MFCLNIVITSKLCFSETNTLDLSLDVSEGTGLWTSKGKETATDHQASEFMLSRRLFYAKKFDDKSTVKNDIWKKIAYEMVAAGFEINVDKSGIEKLRQKFKNLVRKYTEFLKHINQTGRERKHFPEHYQLLHSILGDKDKYHPKNVFDSLTHVAENTASSQLKEVDEITRVDMTLPDTEETDSIVASIGTCSTNAPVEERHVPLEERNRENTIPESVDRFSKTKLKVKPKSNKSVMVEAFNNAHKESIALQEDQFNKLLAVLNKQNVLLERQNEQRDELIHIFRDINKASST